MKLLWLVLLCLLASAASPRHIPNFSGTSGGGGGSVPTNAQVLMQGENTVIGTENLSCVVTPKGTGYFQPNYNYIGWTGVSGATQYNIYRAVNGGSYPALGSPTYTISASAAATNWSTYSGYFSNQTPAYGNYISIGNTNPAAAAPNNLDHAYFDTAATGIIGTVNGTAGASGADFIGTATLNGTATLVLTGVTGGVATTGSLVGGSGYTNGNYTIGGNGSYFTGGTGTGAKGNLVVSGGAVTSVTMTSPGNGYTVGDVLSCTGTCASNASPVITTGSGFSFTVTANIVPGQGVGDLAGRIPLGTTIASGSGGNGTYTMSAAATGSASGVTVGGVLSGNTIYTYKVSAVVSGVESALSTDAYLPFTENGGLQLANGTFDTCMGTLQTAPITTPLGFSKAVVWVAIQPGSSDPCGGNYPGFMNMFSGNLSANFNLNTGGYTKLHISFLPTTTGLGSPSAAPEICGDVPLVNLSTSQVATYGPSTWSTTAWNTYVIPLSAFYKDSVSGVLQNALYKITWGSNGTIAPNTLIYVEYYFTVN